MGSVIDYVECPQCGGVYHTDFNYKTGQEFGVCYSCGKSHDICLFENENEEYKPVMKYGFGTCMIQNAEGFGKLTVFQAVPSLEEIKEFLATLNGVFIDIESSYLSVWNTDKGQLDCLFGMLPKYCDECFDLEDVSKYPSADSFNDEGLPF